MSKSATKLRDAALADPDLVGSLLAAIRYPDRSYDGPILASRLGDVLPLIKLSDQGADARKLALPYVRVIDPRYAWFGFRLIQAPSTGTTWNVAVWVAVVAKPLCWYFDNLREETDQCHAIARMRWRILGSVGRKSNYWKDTVIEFIGPLLSEDEAKSRPEQEMIIGFHQVDDIPAVFIEPKILEGIPTESTAYAEMIFESHTGEPLHRAINPTIPEQEPTKRDIDRATRAGKLVRSIASSMTLRGAPVGNCNRQRYRKGDRSVIKRDLLAAVDKAIEELYERPNVALADIPKKVRTSTLARHWPGGIDREVLGEILRSLGFNAEATVEKRLPVSMGKLKSAATLGSNRAHVVASG